MIQHSALSTQHSWFLRLLLAALLAFCSQVILWTPVASLIDAALLALGYVALSGLLLEIAARYRLRDLFGLLALGGIAGMANGLILNPQSALTDVPRTLISRAMGGHAIAGLIALALFLLLTDGNRRSRRLLIIVLVAAAGIGVGWGLWAHWSALAFDNGVEASPIKLLLDGALGAMLITLALMLVKRGAAPTDLSLDRPGWAFSLVVLIGLLVLHLLQGQIDVLSLSLIVTLSAFSIMIIWFQKRQKGMTLLDSVGRAPISWTQWIALVVVFALGGVVGYGLPRGTGTDDPLTLIGALFTAYGLIWLPALTIVIGARAFTRQARAMRL